MLKIRNIVILTTIILACVGNLLFFDVFNVRNELLLLKNPNEKVDFSVVESKLLADIVLMGFSIIAFFVCLKMTPMETNKKKNKLINKV